MTEIAQRFSFDPDAKQILVHTGKVEIGQRVHSAFEKIVAQTLQVDSSHVRISSVTTQSSPDDGMTVGSLSVQVTGASLKSATIALRLALIHEAAQQLDTDADDITLDPNTLDLTAHGKRCSLFVLPTAKNSIHSLKGCGYATASTIADSIVGARKYIQDFALPEMIHARALRGRKIKLSNSDNVRLITDSGFSALVADTEVALNLAWARIETQQATRDTSFDGPVTNWIQQQRVQTHTSGDTSSMGSAGNQPVIQSATRPFLLHASIAPSCAIARFSGGVLEIWTHSQGIFPLRNTIAKHLNINTDDVIVRHVPSAGCYGHSGADDAAMDAVLVSLQTQGVPVRVLWTRQDDFQYSPVGAAMHVQVEAQLSNENSIESWRQTIWSCPHAQRPGSGGNTNMAAAIEQNPKNRSIDVGDLPSAIGGGAARNATPPYAIQSVGITTHIVQDLPVRTSSIRGLGAQMNVVCIEAAVDKLAASCGADPLEFRIQHLRDSRACEVLRQLRTALGTRENSQQENEAIGIGYSRYKEKAAYAAVAASVRLTDEVQLVDIWSVVDAGQIVDRSGALNQIEGGIIQAASWTLCEGVLLRGGYIDAASWDDYPILGWSGVPKTHTSLIGEQSGLPYLGVGECMVGPASAAIVSAVSKAAGYSMADLPLTYEKFLQAASDV